MGWRGDAASDARERKTRPLFTHISPAPLAGYTLYMKSNTSSR